MRGKSRLPGEAWLDWELRTLRRARGDIHRGASGRWSTIVLQRVWELWGHIARQEGLTRDVTQWRNLRWWCREQSLQGGLRHPSRFCPHVDPERLIQEVVTKHGRPGECWEEAAQDRGRWRDLREAFVKAQDVLWATERQIALEDADHIRGAPPGGPPEGRDLVALGGPFHPEHPRE
jgi:hypothetical protein